MNDLFGDIVPIPECDFLVDGKRFKSPSDVAREMLTECREWQKKHPKQDVISIVTHDWVSFIKQNL